MGERSRRCHRCGEVSDVAEWAVPWIASEGTYERHVCPDCQTGLEQAARQSVERIAGRFPHARWTLVWALAVLGAVGGIVVIAESAYDIGEQGLDRWLDQPMSATEFFLLIALALMAVVAVLGGILIGLSKIIGSYDGR